MIFGFIPSWELKDIMVFTEKGRKYIGELFYQNKKYLVYYISKIKKRVYVSQVIDDIEKAVDYKNIIIFVEDFRIVSKSNEHFMFGKDAMIIVKPKKEFFNKMREFQNKDVYEILEKVYRGKEILLSNWEKANYMTESKQYIIFMPFLDTEKLHKLNIYYKDNVSSKKTVDILTLKDNVSKINEILTKKTNIIEIDSLLGGISNVEKE